MNETLLLEKPLTYYEEFLEASNKLACFQAIDDNLRSFSYLSSIVAIKLYDALSPIYANPINLHTIIKHLLYYPLVYMVADVDSPLIQTFTEEIGEDKVKEKIEELLTERYNKTDSYYALNEPPKDTIEGKICILSKAFAKLTSFLSQIKTNDREASIRIFAEILPSLTNAVDIMGGLDGEELNRVLTIEEIKLLSECFASFAESMGKEYGEIQ